MAKNNERKNFISRKLGLIAQLVKLGLKQRNIEVDIAYDGLLGLTLAQRNYYLLIKDIILPEISVLHLCKKLRENGFKTPILLLIAYSIKANIIKGLVASLTIIWVNHLSLVSR